MDDRVLKEDLELAKKKVRKKLKEIENL